MAVFTLVLECTAVSKLRLPSGLAHQRPPDAVKSTRNSFQAPGIILPAPISKCFSCNSDLY